MMDQRRVTYKLYPTSAQIVQLERLHDNHRALYNAALQERMDAYKKHEISIRKGDQEKSVTQIRADDPEYRSINAQSLQVTLKRVDEAYQHFFRRVKKGSGKAGFPRFKSKDRFSGWGYKSHGDGWTLKPGEGFRHGRLRLSGVGTIKIRGEARTPGRPKVCSITRKSDGWWASVVLECETHREIAPDARPALGLDWGVETYATLAWGVESSEAQEVKNERLWQQSSEDLKDAQRDLSKALRGKRSKRAQRHKRVLAKRHRKLANRRKNHIHQLTSQLVKHNKMIVTESLTVSNMTRSAKGTEEAPGRNVAQKSGLNREILDTSPSAFLKALTYKAEEAGCELIIAPTRSLKPSQRCPVSGATVKKRLQDRSHELPDGSVISRDHAAAATMLRWGLEQQGKPVSWLGTDHGA
ncbi:RNA-guided endonuclease TnpB family protein [Sulfitobacter sp. R18_1]|uniref:RNA-guided endonuclease InsQ/TnpB family protein n=1 Tax=Sulfitobacter sp. R18_1 TaxID=2821104 RepID=UPI001ADC6C51|nr:RNA-guided endonuclease TnpB family protein [Sulfitobacter sp. R18_1]MBO9427903.1 transposase [Sulfitobacter sp. R18_1]